MPKFTLDDINRAADKQFGNFEVEIDGEETLVFLNPLRLPKDKRKQLGEMFQKEQLAKMVAEEPGLDMFDLYQRAFAISAASEAHYFRLTEVIGDEPAKWSIMFNAFNGTAELGEASASES